MESKRLTQIRPAAELGVTPRHLQRLQKAFRLHGAEGLVSKRRGKASNNRLRDAFKTEVMSIVRERYADFKPTFAREKLIEVHSLRISRESFRGLSKDAWSVDMTLQDQRYN